MNSVTINGRDQAQPAPSLATGHDLNAATWTDFVQRLRYDCKGERVRDHCTAAAIFIVEQRRIVCGLDMDYTEQRLVYFNSGESECFSPKEYWDQCDRHEKAGLNKAMQLWSECQFMKASEDDQWHVLGELEDHTVTGWQEEWVYPLDGKAVEENHDFTYLRRIVEAVQAALLQEQQQVAV